MRHQTCRSAAPFCKDRLAGEDGHADGRDDLITRRDDQIGNAAHAGHPKRGASRKIFARRETADKLPRCCRADLYQHHPCSILGLDADFATFIVSACQRQIVSRPEQARDQEIVGDATGDRASLQLRVGKPGGDGYAVSAGWP